MATFFISFVSAIVGVYAYIRYRWGLCQKSKRLEGYLREEKAKQKDKGQRSVIQITRDVGLPEDEIIQVSFRNERVARRVTIGEDGLAEQRLFEYKE